MISAYLHSLIFDRRSRNSMLRIPAMALQLLLLSSLITQSFCATFWAQHAEMPICRGCACEAHLRTVECMPRHAGDPFELPEKEILHLPEWADSLVFRNLTLTSPHFPRFAPSASLRHLRVQHCTLRPALLHSFAFEPFSALETIQITECELADRQWSPQLFRPLRHLRTLDLSNNRLRDIPAEIAFADGLVLERLDLSGNPLCPSRYAAFPPARQISLQRANARALNDSHLTFGTDGQNCVEVPIPDGQWTVMEHLRLADNPILRVHASAIPRLAPLRLLDLSRAGVVPEEILFGGGTDPRSANMRRWHRLSLREARIDPTAEGGGAVSSAQWTSPCSPQLEWLDISEIGLDGELRLDGCGELHWLYTDGNAFSGMRAENGGPKRLMTLSARDNRLTRWPEALLLQSERTLQSVNLAGNGIARVPDGIGKRYPSLGTLDLSRNALTHFRATDYSLRLVFLNLSGNALRNFDFGSSDSLITLLDLSWNALREFSALWRMPSLEHLHLDGNPALHFHHASSSALRSLHLANCTLQAFPDLSRLRALRELDVRGNRLQSIPGARLPPDCLSALNLEGNKLRSLGWDWHAAQLNALRELRVADNPLECACALPQSIAQLAANQSDIDGHQCAEGEHWQHPLLDNAALLWGALDSRCAQRAQFSGGGKEGGEDQSPLLLFLLPFLLITASASLVAAALYIAQRGDLRLRQRFGLFAFAYRPVSPPKGV